MGKCRHLEQVKLSDGGAIWAASLDRADPYRRERTPAFGLYLDPSWSPPWAHRQLEWPDFGLPSDIEALRRELTELIERARRGEDVEVGCIGGHGRTGTALACAAVLTGTPAAEAVGWIREPYCRHAVEGVEQEQFVRDFDTRRGPPASST
jgi:hypothetical protein